MIGRVAWRVVRLAGWLARLEIGIWRSLFLWVTRRVPGRRSGVQTFPYAKEVSPLLGVFIFVSALEIPVAHLLIPWRVVKLAFLSVGVWGLLWMIGFLAGMRVFQHLLDDAALRIRHGTQLDLELRWEDVETVRAARASVPTKTLVHLDDGEHGTTASVAVLKQTRVAVKLRRPVPLALPAGPTSVAELRFYADDPHALVAAAREHLIDPTRTVPAA